MKDTKIKIVNEAKALIDKLLATGDVSLTFSSEEKITLVQEKRGDGKWHIRLFVNKEVPSELLLKCHNDHNNYKVFVLTSNNKLEFLYGIKEES